MASLLSTVAKSQKPQQPPGQQPQIVGELSSDEKALMQDAITQCMKLIYDKKGFKTLLKTIQTTVRDDPPFLGLANVASQILFRVKQASVEQQVDLTDDIMLYVAKYVVEDLIRAAIKAGIYRKDFPQGFIDGAYVRTVDMYRASLQKAGMIDQGHYQRVWDNMKKFSREGTLLTRLGMNRATRRRL